MDALLTRAEQKVFARLSTPQKIQDFLDQLPINFEIAGETYMSPRRVLREKTVHCFEAAVLGAAALAYHGARPLLMDLKAIPRDDDHVITLFKQNGLWGALSKTNHAMLRYRDPIYRTPRELAMSYAHEYVMDSGRKSMRSYSAPFDLSKYALEDWLTTEEDLVFVVNDLDASRHFPIAPEKIRRRMRKANAFEIQQLAGVEEWPEPKNYRDGK